MRKTLSVDGLNAHFSNEDSHSQSTRSSYVKIRKKFTDEGLEIHVSSNVRSQFVGVMGRWDRRDFRLCDCEDVAKDDPFIRKGSRDEISLAAAARGRGCKALTLEDFADDHTLSLSRYACGDHRMLLVDAPRWLLQWLTNPVSH